jgi:hypothetical protein
MMLRIILNGIEYFGYFIGDSFVMSLSGMKRRRSPIYEGVCHHYHPLTRLLICEGERSSYTFGRFNPTEDEIIQEVNSHNFKYLLENHSLIGSDC